MNPGLTIALDIDGVVADFNGALSKALAGEGCFHPAGRPYCDDDFSQWELVKCIEPAHRPALERISTRRGFCTTIERYEGAQQFYKYLRKYGRVVALTTAWKGASWEQERYEWLLSFGFSDPEIQIVRTHDEKRAFPCDVIVEDRLETLQGWPPGAMKVLVNRPWNQQPEHRDQGQMIMRAYNYPQVVAFVKAARAMAAVSEK